VPSSIANKTNYLLADPLTDKPPHGARSELIIQLLREFLRNIDKPPATTDEELAKKVATICILLDGDKEALDCELRNILLNVLEELGYVKTVQLFRPKAT